MSKRQPKFLIEDVIDSGNKILEYTKNLTLEGFIAARITNQVDHLKNKHNEPASQ
jgi:uncharacterized protein with HEPN domain